ncbi:hypothetical protein CAOG_03628 [Capsaspora owczarzaki ATCC 30864]|uniref:BZIP domain-containing protein n=1 Tax=Capsaspora owczarzaki (strain ATCC 30864) TaxID=595528 RepID=A0A0D2WPR1_CAPO3|nr:hypothetical protein CAOG_03628 [Capsaspora owczarzaki ATCC 30864]KJE92713.1 hypothetical protein CAOG_003628 [Capsaspora owczarzaki ATCC 30864]|eukprot:XP_004363356.1 hypothetical protein CAOG_03628 [Capsaspora owczarzaki ATCC 30864]
MKVEMMAEAAFDFPSISTPDLLKEISMISSLIATTPTITTDSSNLGSLQYARSPAFVELSAVDASSPPHLPEKYDLSPPQFFQPLQQYQQLQLSQQSLLLPQQQQQPSQQVHAASVRRYDVGLPFPAMVQNPYQMEAALTLEDAIEPLAQQLQATEVPADFVPKKQPYHKYKLTPAIELSNAAGAPSNYLLPHLADPATTDSKLQGSMPTLLGGVFLPSSVKCESDDSHSSVADSRRDDDDDDWHGSDFQAAKRKRRVRRASGSAPSAAALSRRHPHPYARPDADSASQHDADASDAATLSSTEHDSSDESKVAKLEKNRQSARDCRKRKKQYIGNLEAKVEFLTEENARLARQLAEFLATSTKLVPSINQPVLM